MKRRLVIGRPARQDFQEAVRWYDQKTGERAVGDRFLGKLNNVLLQVASDPHRFTPSPLGGRRVLLDPFPYALHFMEIGNILHVVAIWHRSRDPRKLRQRFGGSH